MEKNKECIFCKIVQKKDEKVAIKENKGSLAILDIFPAELGHVLIISKRCVSEITELKEEEVGDIMKLAKDMINLLKEKLEVKAFNLVNNIGFIAGQRVFHFHLHIIPKFKQENGLNFLRETPFISKKSKEIFDLLKIN